jgi:hypothetical protein
MKNRNDAVELRKKAQELYERLSVLTFVDEYLETTPNATETKEELIDKIEKAVEAKTSSNKVKTVVKEEVVNEVKEDTVLNEDSNSIELKEEIEDKVELKNTETEELISEIEIENPVEEKIDVEVPVKKSSKKQLTLEEEFKDAISVDITADLFRKPEKVTTKTKPSLNDTLMQKNIQVGLNDRIAFVKHLFNHSQADFNRVLSQLNSIKNQKEAKQFITKMVKPDYDWTGKEEYEERLMELIERKF